MRINSTKEQPVSASHWRKGGGADWLPDHDNNKKVKVKKNTLAQGRKKNKYNKNKGQTTEKANDPFQAFADARRRRQCRCEYTGKNHCNIPF